MTKRILIHKNDSDSVINHLRKNGWVIIKIDDVVKTLSTHDGMVNIPVQDIPCVLIDTDVIGSNRSVIKMLKPLLSTHIISVKNL